MKIFYSLKDLTPDGTENLDAILETIAQVRYLASSETESAPLSTPKVLGAAAFTEYALRMASWGYNIAFNEYYTEEMRADAYKDFQEIFRKDYPEVLFKIQAYNWLAGSMVEKCLNTLMPENVDIKNNFQNTMEDLKNAENKYFVKDREREALAYLNDLESKILEEGSKSSPDLNFMKKSLYKSKILREALCAELTDQKQIDEITQASSKLVENFFAWEKIQRNKGGFSATSMLVAGIASGLLATQIPYFPAGSEFKGFMTAAAFMQAMNAAISFANEYGLKDRYQTLLKEQPEIKAKALEAASNIAGNITQEAVTQTYSASAKAKSQTKHL